MRVLEFSSERARASFWHRVRDAKSTEQTEPIKQSGQTVESEREQHARKKKKNKQQNCVQKQTRGEKPHSM